MFGNHFLCIGRGLGLESCSCGSPSTNQITASKRVTMAIKCENKELQSYTYLLNKIVASLHREAKGMCKWW